MSPTGRLPGRPPGRLPGRLQAGWAHALCAAFDRVFWRCRISGAEQIPPGPAILAGNHAGLMDGPVVMGAAPRGVHFLIKQELAKGLLGQIMLAGGQVPVDRSAGGQALKVCLALLRRGRLVGIFPEGTRGDGQMRQIQAGVGWLAVHSGAPVVPFACLGTRRQGESIGHFPGPGRRLDVSFGPPVDLSMLQGSRRQRVGDSLEPIAQAMRTQLAAAVARTGMTLPTDQGRRDQP
ncbi:MAG: 1-acyl-sn-glycerol-3-phosphate acyltransferase [Micrococcales bacterium]|nr:1-acyl-sn-glycerol-3-phosphate acyltransferase [Micrococcales bacterium]